MLPLIRWRSQRLVKYRREGHNIYYSLADSHVMNITEVQNIWGITEKQNNRSPMANLSRLDLLSQTDRVTLNKEILGMIFAIDRSVCARLCNTELARQIAIISKRQLPQPSKRLLALEKSDQ
jgi:hypothetical protein